MKMSRAQAIKRLEELKKKAKDVSRATRVTIATIGQIKTTIFGKKDGLKVADIRKKIGRL